MNRLNQVLKQLTLSALVIMATVNAFAADKKEGGNAGGGGKGIVCRDENFVEKIYLADTMDYVKAGGLKQFALATDDESVLKAIAELVEKSNPQKIYPHPLYPAQKVSLAYLMEYTQQRLRLASNFELSNVDDDNIDPASLPPGCQKVQLAFTNVVKGEMSLNPNFEMKLSWVQRGFLKLHEVLIAIRAQPGADTTPIRKEVERYAKMLDQNIDQVSPMMRSMLLKGRKAGRNAEEEKALEFYDVNNCYKVANDFLRPEDELKKNCYAASVVQGQFQERPYSKLLRMPKEMLCRTTAVTTSDAGLSTRSPFMIKLIESSAGQYRIEMGSQVRNSTRVNFSSEARDGYQLTNSFGRFDFRASFEGDVNVFADHYNERTGFFSGSLQFGDMKRWVSYKMVCDGGPVQTGM
jgi:hypothetical protein